MPISVGIGPSVSRGQLPVGGADPISEEILAVLLHYWKCDESSGAALADVLGTADMTAVNSPGTAAGIVGTSRQCTASSSQAFTRASQSDLQLGAVDFTIFGWAYPDSLGFFPMIWSHDTDTGHEVRLHSTTGWLSFIPNNFTNYLHSTAMTTGAWNFFAVRRDRGAGKYWLTINSSTEEFTSASDPGAGSTTLGIGRRGDGSGFYWDGRLDEIGFCRSAEGGGGCLSDDAIDRIYNSGSGKTYPFAA